MVTDYNAATLRRLTELLENSLCNILDEQLSLAAQWARQSDPLVMELTQRLLDQEEALIPFFFAGKPVDLRPICRNLPPKLGRVPAPPVAVGFLGRRTLLFSPPAGLAKRFSRPVSFRRQRSGGGPPDGTEAFSDPGALFPPSGPSAEPACGGPDLIPGFDIKRKESSHGFYRL